MFIQRVGPIFKERLSTRPYVIHTGLSDSEGRVTAYVSLYMIGIAQL